MATRTMIMPHVAAGGPNLAFHNSTSIDRSKRPCPVIKTVVTDEDIGAEKEMVAAEKINLSKVVKLLADPHSSSLYDRHVLALKKINKHYADGFIMKDLVLVFKILNICADRVSDVPDYVEPMSGLLLLCGLPSLQEKVTDELAYERIAVECVEQLEAQDLVSYKYISYVTGILLSDSDACYLMRVPNDKLRRQICSTLKNFYCNSPPKSQHPSDKYRVNSLEYNRRIIEQSDVTETFVKSLDLLEEDDIEMRLIVIDILQQLSKTSSWNCNQMLKAEAAFKICSRLLDPDPSHQILFRSIEILWNLLENGSSDQAAQQLNNINCIDQLRSAFVQQITQGYSEFDKQLRNDILIVTSLICSLCPTAPFIETGFAKILTLFATHQEVKSHNALVKHLKLTADHDDFELKKMFINFLTLLSKDQASIPIMSESRVILALFSYVRPFDGMQLQPGRGDRCPPISWSPSQYEEITLLSMSTLCTLAPLMLADYMTCQGSTRLLLMIEWCIGSDDYNGFGNGFHAAGGRGSKRAHMRWCIRLVRSVLSTYDDTVLTDFTEQGAISQLTALLKQFTERRNTTSTVMAEDYIDIEMETDLLVILSIICQHDIHRKELFGTTGVDMLVEYLKIDIGLLTSGLGHYCLLISAITCVWSSVIGCYLTEDYFLEKEGVFILLDLLQTGPRSLYNQLLGCLLDLSENQKTWTHIAAWRGLRDESFAHLCCHLWREEEREMGVQRKNNGLIADAEKPLLGRHQDTQKVISLPANCSSEAIVDVTENIRAKIYALFTKTGFLELPGLTTEDQLTLVIIEHYLDFKVGEVWTEIMSELTDERVRPTTPDREALEAISSAIQIRANQVIHEQCQIVETERQQDIIEEQEFYAQLRENRRQAEKLKKNYDEFISRTSKHMLLKAAKEKQSLAIEASRVRIQPSSATAHQTAIPNLNVTSFCGRSVAVDSIPQSLTNGRLATYDHTTGTVESRKPLLPCPDSNNSTSSSKIQFTPAVYAPSKVSDRG